MTKTTLDRSLCTQVAHLGVFKLAVTVFVIICTGLTVSYKYVHVP